jgi:hypothetical protein
MRDHETCEDAINRALARGDDGRAEFLQSRCELNHPEHRSTPVEEPPPAVSIEEESG